MCEDSILWHFHSCCILLHLVANGCSDHFLAFENRQAAQLAKRTKRQAALSLRQLFPKLLHCFIILCTSNPYRKPAWNFEPFFELFGKVNGVEISSMLVLVKTDRTMSCTASRSGNKLRCFTSFPIFSSKANVGCSTKDKSWFTGRSKMFKVLLIRKR